MAGQALLPYAIAAGVILASLLLMRRKRAPSGRPQEAHRWANVPTEKLPGYIQDLLSALPGSVILQTDVAAFQRAVDYCFAQQTRAITPACIVRPADAQQLGKAVTILKKEHDRRSRATEQDASPMAGFFSIRSGGANPGLGAAMVQDGVVIDLSLFSSVTPAADGSSVTVGTGAKWIDVYKALDEKRLTVVGGRISPVGVGGLTLQGGISFYSPKYGFACSNVLSYEVVLADGSVVVASATERSDLWRVLKGGSNNFGIVTYFTLRSMPSAPVWVGHIISPSFQHAKALKTWHDYLERVSSGQPGAFDENAAGPIFSFMYVRSLRLQIIGHHMVHTKAPADRKWPDYWKKAGFTSLWSYYRGGKVQSHTKAVENLSTTLTGGIRFVQGTTTVRNDTQTFEAVYGIYSQALQTLRHVKGLVFLLNFQAVLPGWMNKGDPNILGLEDCSEPLTVIGFALTWTRQEDDEFVRSTVRLTIEQMEAAAAARQADHPYRFMNYCMEWQNPYQGCSENVKRLMREASQKYDPDSLFQTSCSGGFKLGREQSNA